MRKNAIVQAVACVVPSAISRCWTCSVLLCDAAVVLRDDVVCYLGIIISGGGKINRLFRPRHTVHCSLASLFPAGRKYSWTDRRALLPII